MGSGPEFITSKRNVQIKRSFFNTEVRPFKKSFKSPFTVPVHNCKTSVYKMLYFYDSHEAVSHGELSP